MNKLRAEVGQLPRKKANQKPNANDNVRASELQAAA